MVEVSVMPGRETQRIAPAREQAGDTDRGWTVRMLMFNHFFRKLTSVFFAAPHRQPCETVCTDAMHWTLTEEGQEFFGEVGPDLTGWTKCGRIEHVKQNRQRTISKISLPHGTVFIKHCKANSLRAWMRELLRPAKARLEFENALIMRDRGLVAVEPLAWGAESTWKPGDSYLLTRGLNQAEPFNLFLNYTIPKFPLQSRPAVSRQVARGFAQYLAKLHDAGVIHPDPHTGNFLIEFPANRIPRFTLIDLHDVVFGPPLSWSATKANLALLNRWFLTHATRTDRLRAWQAYFRTRTTLSGDANEMAREIEAATVASTKRFWNSRLNRYFGENRDCYRVRGPIAAGHALRTVPKDWLREWLADPDAVFSHPRAKVLKDAPGSTLVQLDVPTENGTQSLIFKRFRLLNFKAVLKNALRPSAAVRSWNLGNNVLERSLPTPRVLAVFQRRRFGIPLTGYVVFDTVNQAVNLTDGVKGLAPLPESERTPILRTWINSLARLVRQMHDRDVSHRDLKAPNILMEGAAVDRLTARPVLIDLVGIEVGAEVSEAKRIRDLGRLNASFVKSAQISRTDRLRFLRAYLFYTLKDREQWKQMWRRVEQATQAKVAKNERSGRPLA